MEDLIKFYRKYKVLPSVCDVLLKADSKIIGISCKFDFESLEKVAESYSKCKGDCRNCPFYDNVLNKCNKPVLKIKFCYE